ncbi:hypothetical protein MMC30_008184, partial [Trapelia coarctata]|nr:hypothetical protein [Trapelia coarctata]
LPSIRATLSVNYYGTLHATQTFLPLLTPRGRMVNVSSFLASLSGYPPSLVSRFHSATSPAQITELMDEYVATVAEGKVWVEGKSAYDVSKAGCTGMTRVIAIGEREKEGGGGGGRLVNSCCPGYVKTDLSPRGTKTPDEGAKTPVLLALGDIGGQTGLFWKNEVVIDW